MNNDMIIFIDEDTLTGDEEEVLEDDKTKKR